MSREAKILTAILVVVVGGMIALFALTNKDTPAPVGDKTKITRETSHKEGTGVVKLVEFGDFQCPACGTAHPTVQQILKDFDGKVEFYFRNFPLSMHPNAVPAALAAEAAGNQGKYWEMHNKLYESQKDWTDLGAPTDKFVSYAKEIGLDTAKFRQALIDKTFQGTVDQDQADGEALGIQGTPTFFVNGVQVTSGFSYASLRDAINAALGESPAPTSGGSPSPLATPITTPTPAP